MSKNEGLDDTLINGIQIDVQFFAFLLKCFFFDGGFYIFAPQIKGVDMAKQQTFSDKLKKKKKNDFISVKVVRAVKSAGGNYKFNEKFEQIEDINKISSIK